jgi:hypothetical protein
MDRHNCKNGGEDNQVPMKFRLLQTLMFLLAFPPASRAGVVLGTEADCPVECPNGVSEWLKLREQEAKEAGYFCDKEFYSKCFDKMDPTVKGCFEEFFKIKGLGPSGQIPVMGPYRFQDSYYESEPAKSLTDLNTIPAALRDPDFLAQIKDATTLGDAIARFKKRNPRYTVIRYSGNAKAMDQSKEEDRLLVMIPGAKEDRYYQFTVPTLAEQDAAKSKPRPKTGSKEFLNSTPYDQFSLVVVDKSKVSKAGDRPEVYFRDYRRTGTSHGINIEYRNRPSDVRESCLKCHSRGVQAIFPHKDKTSVEDARAIERLNGRILEYGIPSNATTKISAAGNGLTEAGLPIGPVSPSTRTDEFMASCAPEITVERRAYIKGLMNCSGCHNGKPVQLTKEIPDLKKAFGWGMYELAPIYNMNGSTLKLLVTEHNSMPPGNSSTPEERAALWNCLEKENEELSKNARTELLQNYQCEAATLARYGEKGSSTPAPGSITDSKLPTPKTQNPSKGESSRDGTPGVAQ